ncbi:hypothetical protein [Novosphingobium sp. Leaf2]|uniref:hypothetical protein n=1 Tax=Novosphingobium sp. Leaf2 TaxID=1735670 RepID=UPI0006FF795D|nr:hypothetical protein [Novosphingobium sp. Leaf2]KQM19685.1 hypothetical protein ASE49_05635 [Novosphingobium sp. Leaf2]
MAAKLKVFATAIGFHDAYVAVTSRKAALAAWGAKGDLFASGAARQVTDPELTKAPLADPGTVITVARGTLDEHLASLPKVLAKSKAVGKAKDGGKPKAAGKAGKADTPRPKRPSRAALDDAQARLDRDRQELADEIARIEAERQTLADRIVQLGKDAKARTAHLERTVKTARRAYDAAMTRWRAAD